jgi:hypothetical protein
LALHGWTLIKSAPFLPVVGPVRETDVLEVASVFGVPSARDGGRAVWPVMPRPERTASFSGRSGPAGFHTDAQYRIDPEDFVCMFAVRPAADGGGSTLLLPFHAAVAAVRASRAGAALLAAMERPGWQWKVPREFDGAPQPQARTAVLDGCGRIRWRADNIAALAPGCAADTPARIDEAFATASGRIRVHLERGDLLVLDNHRVLHARTDFTDRRRLLLRVRLWEAAC